jgi:hypothetical protein
MMAAFITQNRNFFADVFLSELSAEGNNSVKHTTLSAVLQFVTVPHTWLIIETETFLSMA